MSDSNADPRLYRFPPISLLNDRQNNYVSAADELRWTQARIQEILFEFEIDAHITNVICGSLITRYELELDLGTTIQNVSAISSELSLALGVPALKISTIPDKISTICIDIPNKRKTDITIKEIIGTLAFAESQDALSFTLGRDELGNLSIPNLSALRNLFITGTTGSGKSMCIHSLLISLLYKYTPDDVRFLLIDPKASELSIYNGIPHLIAPVISRISCLGGILGWLTMEINARAYALMDLKCKTITAYNKKALASGEVPLPRIVVVFDEIFPFWQKDSQNIEDLIPHIVQVGHSVGIHIVISSNAPLSEKIFRSINPSYFSRLAFAAPHDASPRNALNVQGADALSCPGELLYLPVGTSVPSRLQGCYLSDSELSSVVDFIKESNTSHYDETIMRAIGVSLEARRGDASHPTYDELLPAAIDVVLELEQASIPILQRRLKLGYGRAARLIDQMETRGIVGPLEGSLPRQLLITKEEWLETLLQQEASPSDQPLSASLSGDDTPVSRNSLPEDAPLAGRTPKSKEISPTEAQPQTPRDKIPPQKGKHTFLAWTITGIVFLFFALLVAFSFALLSQILAP